MPISIKDSYPNLSFFSVDESVLRGYLIKAYGNNEPANRIIGHLKFLECKGMVIEENYVDFEFLDSYSQYYSKCFETIPKYCKRLHFFKEKVEPTDILNLSELINNKQNEYLGFCVVRPLEVFPICRTILKPSLDEGDFIKVKQKYFVNLSGQHLVVEGSPFIQQDTQVAVCAIASLFMATYYLSQKYCFTPFTTSKIHILLFS